MVVPLHFAGHPKQEVFMPVVLDFRTTGRRQCLLAVVEEIKMVSIKPHMWTHFIAGFLN